MKERRFYIYCDESVKKGKRFSDFYGGVMVDAQEFEAIDQRLSDLKTSVGLSDEIKWTKTDMLRVEPYKRMVDEFFGHITSGKLKVRIMFRQNRYQPTGLTDYHREHHFFLLYYQFLKLCFGLRYAGQELRADAVHLELFFDSLPDKAEKNNLFKRYIYGLQFLIPFIESNVRIREDAIMEVDSHKHILLQCLDMVLGAMAFRLNEMHLEKEPAKRMRGKRTIAKERLYKHILGKVREIYPNFNIGISTSLQGEVLNLWRYPYRHFRFLPKNWELAE
ncbi:MAG: DUF3800 domain-containing protein [Saprospiraceae bacterium]